MKRLVVIMTILVFVGVGVASAAGSGEAEQTERVVYVINGALGDNGFYDSGQSGIERIAGDFGVETRTIETSYDAAQYEPALEAAVRFADVIFVISYGFEDQLREYADTYPEKTFVNIDTVVQNDGGTITSVDFIEEEGAYLAGVVAALATGETALDGVNTDLVIGAVGGDEDPVVNAFMFAYENGASAVAPGIAVERRYLGSWDDTAKGKQATLQLYDAGADVVFQIAGAAGLGVLQAAGERGLYAIGVDTNQNDLVPGHVIASNTKNVGRAIYEVYATIRDGSYVAGEVLEYGLARGGVDIVFDAEIEVLPDSLQEEALAVRQRIIDGDLVIERYRGD